MIYRKLKRTWSHGYGNYIPRMREVFPELNKLSDTQICDRWVDLNIEFYTVKETPVKWWLRLTLPFALSVMLLMFVGLPFHFMISGNWGYSFDGKIHYYNWFKALRLLD